MRGCLVLICIAWLTSLGAAQKPAIPSAPSATPTAAPTKTGESGQPGSVSADSTLKDMFEAKIKAEWEALKNKDKKAYGELLAEDYQGVEVDGRGERNKIQAVNELTDENVFNYTLWGYKLMPLGPDGALVIYESTVQFPPRAQIRYERVYISEVWVKRAGQWKELHYQETRVK